MADADRRALAAIHDDLGMVLNTYIAGQEISQALTLLRRGIRDHLQAEGVNAKEAN